VILHSGLGLFAVGLAGLAVGSFLNVCIFRLPRGRSVVFPPSACPACRAKIRPLDNVPVVAWIALRGRCRVCRAPISARYPIVELANAVAWWMSAKAAPTVPDFLAGALLCSASLVLIFVDFDFQILPDVITLPLAAAGLGLSFFTVRIGWRMSIAGIVVGAGGLYAVARAYRALTGQEGMGLGDVKMLGAIGAFTGPVGVVATVFFASLAGSLVGLALLRKGGGWRTRLPFGVFLGLAGIGAYFWASPAWRWYRLTFF
jgi:leader peptidase (prepilin peptidase)/N-methyltransferase